jgi:hypothetical protein
VTVARVARAVIAEMVAEAEALSRSSRKVVSSSVTVALNHAAAAEAAVAEA